MTIPLISPSILVLRDVLPQLHIFMTLLLPFLQESKAALATAILTKKLTINSLLVDDSVVDDHSTVTMNSIKMEELGLFNGDTVLLKGKKRKNTVAIVNTDDAVSESRVRMTKVVRSNLRY